MPLVALLAIAALFAALGVWQVKRLAWKEALIAHVTAATQAPPLDAGTLAGTLADTTAGPRLAALEYRRVRLAGHYVPAGTALVATSTDLGAGYWVMCPLRLDDGRAIYVNRGFVAMGTSEPALARAVAKASPSGAVTVVGLLRLTEPRGTLLRANHPAADRWYSRDIAAIADARGLVVNRGWVVTRSWFVDATTETPSSDARATDATLADRAFTPVPGLTVLTFPNNHLAYAITWFILAALSLTCVGLVARTKE